MTDEHPNAEDYRNRAERAEQALAELAGQLATERANADKLAEALGDLAFLTAEVLPQPQKEIAAILAAHNLLRIDG